MQHLSLDATRTSQNPYGVVNEIEVGDEKHSVDVGLNNERHAAREAAPRIIFH